jgi:FtsP/CotA-like multicopper oxidase with cupredoxin domain
MAERRGLTRRALLRSGAVGVAGLASSRAARAVTPTVPAPMPDPAYVPRPNATQYVIAIGEASINPDGERQVPAILANGSLPGAEIRVREGDLLRILVENQLPDSPTSIHWHGVLLPAAMDGVPDISNTPIAPGRTYIYEYPIRQSGTYWYHSHYGFQEQQGCYGAFIIQPAEEPLHTERDAVILLGDWLYRSPEKVFAQLRAAAQASSATRVDAGMRTRSGTPTPLGAMQMGSGMPTPMVGMAMGGTATPTGAMKMGGATPMPTGAMQMSNEGADLSDVKYNAFLLNGRGPEQPWTLAVAAGERVRLRLINGGASTYFRLRLDGHPLQITHADGLAVRPVTVDHLLMGMGETYDAVVTIGAPGSYTLHAVAQDGSGQAIGVLHTTDVAPRANRTMPSFDGRALSYADLYAPSPTTLPDGAVQTFRLPLQGDMARYVWMIGGQVWPKADPLLIRRGDRVQVELTNETMMWHPMHLHGHFFRLLQGAGEYCPLKHTVNVAPQETVRIEFTADNPGKWFFHCHNTYHLEAGMAREFHYLA